MAARAISRETVREVRSALPEARVEVLTPDFCGDLDAVARVLDAGPHVFNHNMETVPRLYARVRPQAEYRQSLDVLAFARRRGGAEMLTKSGFMVGLGETGAEVRALLDDLRAAGADVATIGQYLQPTRRNLPVAEYRGAAGSSTSTATTASRSASGWCSADPWCAVRTWRTWSSEEARERC